MAIFKPHPESLANLIAIVEAHEHALALWGFLEITHQHLYGNAPGISPALQAIVEVALAMSRRLDDLVEEFVASYFDDEESTENERHEAVAWARGQKMASKTLRSEWCRCRNAVARGK